MNQVDTSRQDLIDHLMGEVERITPWIQPSLDYGGNTHDMDDIADGILYGRYQLWAGIDAAVVSEVIEYPNCRHLHIFLSGGNRETIEDMRESLETFAKGLGCAALTSVGRRGWARALRDKGYTETMSTVIKRFDTADKAEE